MGKCVAALFALALLAGAGRAPPARAADAPAGPASPAGRPKICLVLSGGGARGMAHIGVLKVLERLEIPIDCIAGTSMGAIVGGLYASGMTADAIESMMRSVDWQEAFRDAPPRRELAFRRKQDDRNFLVRLPLGLKHGEILLPNGLIQGQKLQETLRGRTLPFSDMASFDALPTPFRAVATDLETGQGVIMDKGDLALAMRASMSAPGVFAPVEAQGRLLVDGGLAENLPMDVARAMGADVLIVVDVTFPLESRKELNTALSITNQMLAILIRRDADRQKATLLPQDMLIAPDLGATSATDFTAVAQTIQRGETAAAAMSARLASLSIGATAYRAYLAQRAPPALGDPLIRFVHVDPASQRYEKTIEAQMRPVIGKPLDVGLIDRQITELYGLGDFETIDYTLANMPGGAEGTEGLDVSAHRKSWGPNYIRFGLNLEDDFQGHAIYNVAARFLLTEIDDLGAESLNDVQIGTDPRIYTEFYQPLNAERVWFVAPSARIEAKDLRVYKNDVEIADYRDRELEGDLDVGRELGNWGEIRAGVHRINGAATLRLGSPGLVASGYNNGEYFFKFSYDRLDNVDFPSAGQSFTLQWDADRTELGSNFASDRVSADWLMARTLGRNTILLWSSAGTTLDGRIKPTDLQDFYSLGGFFNLSGLSSGSLLGPNYAIGRAIYFRKIGRGGEGLLEFPAYVGASFEIGNTYVRRGDIGWGSARKDGSVFFGVDTFLGPVFLGTGYDQTGNSAFYLFLGRTF
jgi:NTE family protein